MRLVLLAASSTLLVGGCASRIRTELVGTGHGLVTTRGAAPAISEPSAAPGAGGLPLPRGTYDIDLRIGVPKAQVVDWKITCPGAEQAGTVGEAFDDYRERRLGQLEKERAHRHAQVEKEREHRATLAAQAAERPPVVETTTVLAPGARIVTPVGRVVVTGPTVRTRTTVAPPLPPPPPLPVIDLNAPLELAPGDLGHGVLPARARIVTQSDGVCAVTAVADDPNVRAFFSVTRVRDLGVEEAERKQLLYVGAVDTRGRVTARLVAYGADVEAKQRRLDAEAKARAEAEARRREVENRVDLDRRQRAAADAEQRRQRLEAEAEKRRLRRVAEEHDRRMKAELEARAQWERDAPKRAAGELIIRQREISLKMRLTIIAWLVGECHADPDRRGRIAREQERVRRERQARLEIRLEIERVERERILRIKLEAEEARRVEQARIRAEQDRVIAIRVEAERAEKARIRAEHERKIAIRVEAERAEQARLREERENRDAIERARRDREARELAELELRRTNEALRIRTTITGSLIGFGAKIRTPRPAPLQENPGPAPFDGAVWASGQWVWVLPGVAGIAGSGKWQWHGGGWRDTSRFGATGGETVVIRHNPPPVVTTTVTVEAPPVVVRPPVVVTPGVVIDVGVRPAPRYPRGRVDRDYYLRGRGVERDYQPRNRRPTRNTEKDEKKQAEPKRRR